MEGKNRTYIKATSLWPRDGIFTFEVSSEEEYECYMIARDNLIMRHPVFNNFARFTHLVLTTVP